MSKNELSPIGARIQQGIECFQKRNDSKMSWNVLAAQLGVSPSAPTNWKKGKISNERLKEVAKVLNISFMWVLFGEGNMQTSSELLVSEKETLDIGSAYVNFIHCERNNLELLKELNDLMEKNRKEYTSEGFQNIQHLQKNLLESNQKLESCHQILKKMTENI